MRRGWLGAGWRQGMAVALLCAMAGGLLSLVLVRIERQRLLAEGGERLSAYAAVMARRLDSGLVAWATDVGLLARFETFRREPPDSPALRRLLEDLRGRSSHYAWIGFTGPDGRVIAATGGLLQGADVSSRPWFAPGLAGLYLGDVHPASLLARLLPENQGGGEGAFFVDAAAPVRAADGRVLGVIAGHLTWRWAEAVRDEIQKDSPWPVAPELRVLSADGRVLLGPEAERGNPWTGSARLSGWEDGPSAHPDSVLGFASSRGVPGHPGLGWVTVAERGRDEILRPLWTSILWAGLGTVAVSVLGGLLAAWNAGRFGAVIHRALGSTERGEVARRLERLRDQAWRDPLTGLLNRAGFEAWCAAHPWATEGCAVVAMDLDGFKPINDRYGHAAGDAVLTGIGAWLQAHIRLEDAAVRLGGDEFLLCLPGPPRQVGVAAAEVGARLERALRDGLPTPAGPLSLGCSRGIVLMPADATDMPGAIAAADAALYEVKRRRKADAPTDGAA